MTQKRQKRSRHKFEHECQLQKPVLLRLANISLHEIKWLKEKIAETQGWAEADIKTIRERFGQALGPLEDKLFEHEKNLLAIMKTNKTVLFEERDKIDLENGSLLYSRGSKVKIPRNALELIETQGWAEAIKVAKSVDRDLVDTWPDEKLAVIGAERKSVEEFDYETT